MGATGRIAVGHPVDVSSGVLFNTFLDFALPGALPLSFDRFYSTGLLGGQRGEPLGPGWRHCFQHEFRQTVDGFAYVDSTGAELALEDVGGQFARTGLLRSPQNQLELRGDPNHVELQLYGSDQPTWKLGFARKPSSLDYLLTSIQLNPKVKLTFEYDIRERLVRVTQTRMNRSLRLEYTANDQLASIWFEVAGGRELVARFTFDEHRHLIRVTDRVGEVSAFAYDASGRMVSEARCSGAVYSFRYDVEGRCVYAAGANRHEERTLQYDAARRTTCVTDSHGHVTTYSYNEAGQVTRVLFPLGGEAHYSYDAQARLVSIRGVNKQQRTLEYDDLGRLCAILPPGSALRYTIQYNERHQPTRVTSGADAWSYGFDEEGCCTHFIDPAGQEWSYRYNEYGELVTVRDPLGHEDQRQWGPRGELSAFVTRDGRVWRAGHDSYGRRVSVTDPQGSTSRYTYDRAGNLASVESPDGRTWSYTYDGGGRCTAVKEPGGTMSRARYNACGQVVELIARDGTHRRLEWDTEPGRLLALENARGQRTEWTYDAQGRAVSRRHWDGSVTHHEFDLAANLTALISPTGERYEFDYDAENRLVERRTSDGARTRYEYNGHSRLVKVSALGSEIVYEHDALGRTVAEFHNGVAVRSAYDAMGRRLELNSDLGAHARFDWSPEGLCSAIHHSEGPLRFRHGLLGEELQRILPGGAVFEQAYDRLGRLVEQRLVQPSGAVAEAGWTSPGQLELPIPLRRSFSYDVMGHVAFIDDSSRGWRRFTHDLAGRLQSVQHSTGELELFDYDAAGNRQTAATLADGMASSILEGSLRRSAQGLPMLDIIELSNAGADLSVAISPKGNQTVELQCTGRSLRYEYDGQGRLVRKHVHRNDKVETWSYAWNALGQLVTLTRPDDELWTYEYDAIGRRTAKHGPRGTRRYVWDGLRLLHEMEPSGELTTRLHHPNQPIPVLEQRAGVTHYVLPDQIGSASERVTPDGHVVWAARRGTWGQPVAQVSEGEPGFPGQSYDTESGLYYNHARYYDPELGRYISPDPIGLRGGLNEYAYVPSPVEWMDVLGLTPVTGGPYPWAFQGLDPFLSDGTPDLSNPQNRYVNTDMGKGYKDYKARSFDEDGKGGKCMAVVIFNDPDDPSEPVAFISGHGNPTENTVRANAAIKHTKGDSGNWTHSENQALNYLDKNNVTSATIYVDRPPCSHCQNTLPDTLKKMADSGRNYKVLFYDHERKMYRDFDLGSNIDRTHGTCDGSCP
ncbi:type IV secretion protein Rhs [Cystobacter fuscus]|uniref:Type IV secretion protein Rhs n=1 Tax=Cystobacter fuscus TaxID=43 RepID=A0A250JG65_9BACT|nr:RHS repeat-associated core domain-containing protein [Cystobacter fuscus]ATB42603.1 type IV secretion protein Rhs [Cystobacter fuscus]